MAVLVIARVPDSGAADRDQWRERNKALPQQHGFLFQGDGPAPGGWQVVSAWESRADFERYFDAHIRPYIPAEVPMAQPEIQELEATVTK
jgi:heme-degrading monooxygenase HmoA